MVWRDIKYTFGVPTTSRFVSVTTAAEWPDPSVYTPWLIGRVITPRCVSDRGKLRGDCRAATSSHWQWKVDGMNVALLRQGQPRTNASRV